MRHIPARGRKPHLTLPPASRRTDASHPRQGTETNKRRCPAACCCRMRYIPARGRKHIAVCVIHNWEDRDTSYPREGMETEGYPRTAPSVLMCHIPARGRKPGKQHFSIVARARCVTSPPGDGNTLAIGNDVLILRCVTSPQGDGNILLSWLQLPKLMRHIPARGRKQNGMD